MADESKKASNPGAGETNNSMSDEEIGKLSDLISDSDTTKPKFDGDDTSTFTRKSDEDTGKIKPVQD
jgi:hypothetical protein